MKNFIKILSTLNKPITILPEHLDDLAKEQFINVMSEPYVTAGALMPDSHGGYEMPIGAVCSTKDMIVPQFVGFDIGCGMCAYKTEFKKSDLTQEMKEVIHKNVSTVVPLGFSRHNEKQTYISDLPLTDFAKDVLNNTGLYQLGTLGGGNHFIEIGYSDSDESIWIIVHSGSRGMGAKIASNYIKKAYKASEGEFEPTYESIYTKNKEKYEKIEHDAFQDPKTANFRENNLEGFKKSVARKIEKEVKKDLEKAKKLFYAPADKIEGIYPLSINSIDGQNYIKDLNYCLDFALMNRKNIIEATYNEMTKILKVEPNFDTSNEENFINRNHNHAELDKKSGEWIHRKGATHAELGMRGVIPGNMRDGSFIVIGKGNDKTLNSSSHGAGRIKSRKAAKESISLECFQKQMAGIVGTINEETIDESPDAYKDIFKVMEEQSDSVDILEHIKVLINIKDDTKDLY